jgi:hypothetical protein
MVKLLAIQVGIGTTGTWRVRLIRFQNRLSLYSAFFLEHVVFPYITLEESEEQGKSNDL